MEFVDEGSPLLDSVTQSGAGRSTELAARATSELASRKARFNLLFLKRFWRLMRVIHPRLCSSSLGVLFLLILTRAAEEYNYYNSGLLPSRFYAAFGAQDLSQFKEALWVSTVVVTSVCVCKSGRELIAGFLYVKWRSAITRFLHSRHFLGINYYLVNFVKHRIDNPDQRITQDADKFCYQMMGAGIQAAVPKIILSPFIIAYYTYRTYQSMGYLGTLSIYAFFVVFTVINKFLMGPIVSRVFRQEKLEGNFRFHHVQVRSSAESLAFLQGGKLEGEKADRRLKVLLETQLSVVHWQFPLNLSVNIFDYTSSVISYSLIGIALFSGKYGDLEPIKISAFVSESAFFSLYLLNNFSTLVDQAAAFTDIAAYTHRLGELMEALEELEDRRRWDDGAGTDNKDDGGKWDKDSSSSGSEELGKPWAPEMGNPSLNDDRPPSPPRHVRPHPKPVSPRQPPPHWTEVGVVVRNLSVAPPTERVPLVEGVNLELRRGKNVLVLGDSGCGKTSVLRVMRKLWRPLKGTADLRPDGSHHHVLFLPQRPYLTTGSLADQVTFPEKPKSSREAAEQGTVLLEDRVSEALRLAGLVYLRDRVGGISVEVQENWIDFVSPGEMQKISFARLFFHKPPFAVLDEATCALSEDNEECFYNSVKQLGITVLSVGHRSSLRKHHHCVVVLSGSGAEARDVHLQTDHEQICFS